jgi:hypothetical protein
VRLIACTPFTFSKKAFGDCAITNWVKHQEQNKDSLKDIRYRNCQIGQDKDKQSPPAGMEIQSNQDFVRVRHWKHSLKRW